MRRRAVGAIVGASVAALALVGYAVADAHDVVPGVLTLSDVHQPSDPPSLVPQSGVVDTRAQSGDGTAVDAADVKELWTPVANAATDGKWKTWGIVMDADTGEVLLDSASTTAHTPASTTKILTATTALSDLDPSATLATGTSLKGTDLYLWGEGDLLLARGEGSEDSVEGHAGIADLAADTIAQLQERGITRVTLRWHHDIFTGSPTLDAWKKQDVEGYEGVVGAFAFNGGRTTAGGDSFAEDPGRDVALELAARLRSAGIEAEASGEATLPDGATELARVESATIGQQIRWFLHHSDNTLADQYCRLAAAAAGAEPSFSGATAHVEGTLTDLGISTTGLKMQDCSGLSSDDRISGRTLAETLLTTMDATHPNLRDLVRSLPWGGLDGTLDGRFLTGDAAANVQAKTGSLGSVSSLAGVVTTEGGRTLVFAVGNDSVPGGAAYWTRGVLDDFVEGLSGL